MDDRMPEQGDISARRVRRRAGGVLVVALLSAAVPLVWILREASATATSQIEGGRLSLAQLVAEQADRVVVEAFFAIELETLHFPIDVASSSTGSPPRASYGAEILLEEIIFLDENGNHIGPAPSLAVNRSDFSGIFSAAALADDRTVSPAWIEASTGHTMTAFSVPVFLGDGARVGTVVGLIDLSESLIADLSVPTARLGVTGHVDLVDESGVVVASTDPEHVLSSSHHPEFYTRAARGQIALVEPVPHLHDAEQGSRLESHLMAYAPLQNAPWGIALGGEMPEAMHPVSRLQYRMLAAGLVALITLLLGGFLAIRLFPGPEETASQDRG